MGEYSKQIDHTRSTENNPVYELGKINQTVTYQGTLNVYDCISEGTYNSSHAPEASEIQLD